MHSKKTIIYKSSSALIFDETLSTGETKRNLMLDNDHIQSSILIEKPSFIITNYAKNIIYSYNLYNQIFFKKILFLGLGGGVTINDISNSSKSITKIHCVEIDQNVIDATKKFFYPLEQKNLKIFCDDAISFVYKSTNKYDFIICDIFGPNLIIPEALLNEDFYNKIEKLSPKVFVINCHRIFFKDLLELVKKKYKNIISLAGKNTFLICSNLENIYSFPKKIQKELESKNIYCNSIMENSLLISEYKK